MSTDPVFYTTPRADSGRVTGANTNRDGSGANLVDVITGVAAGTKIERIRAKAEVTTTQGKCRIFLTNGVFTRLFHEFDVPAITASATNSSWADEIFTPNLVLPNASWKIMAGMHNAEATVVWAFGADA